MLRDPRAEIWLKRFSGQNKAHEITFDYSHIACPSMTLYLRTTHRNEGRERSVRRAAGASRLYNNQSILRRRTECERVRVCDYVH